MISQPTAKKRRQNCQNTAVVVGCQPTVLLDIDIAILSTRVLIIVTLDFPCGTYMYMYMYASTKLWYWCCLKALNAKMPKSSAGLFSKCHYRSNLREQTSLNLCNLIELHVHVYSIVWTAWHLLIMHLFCPWYYWHGLHAVIVPPYK